MEIIKVMVKNYFISFCFFVLIVFTACTNNIFENTDSSDSSSLLTALSLSSNSTYLTSWDSVQLNVSYTPTTASNKEVSWEILQGSSIATISDSGILSISGDGTVKVKVVSKTDSAISAECSLIINTSEKNIILSKDGVYFYDENIEGLLKKANAITLFSDGDYWINNAKYKINKSINCFYIAEKNKISAYKIDVITGKVELINTVSFPSGYYDVDPYSLVLSPNKDYLYTIGFCWDNLTNTMQTFKSKSEIDLSTGEIKNCIFESYNGEGNVQSMVSTDKYIYVLCYNAYQYLYQYEVNPSDGTWTEKSKVYMAAKAPTCIKFNNDNSYAYVACSKYIESYQVANDGSLTLKGQYYPGTETLASTCPLQIDLSPDGKYLFGAVDHACIMFEIENGTLINLGKFPQNEASFSTGSVCSTEDSKYVLQSDGYIYQIGENTLTKLTNTGLTSKFLVKY